MRQPSKDCKHCRGAGFYLLVPAPGSVLRVNCRCTRRPRKPGPSLDMAQRPNVIFK